MDNKSFDLVEMEAYIYKLTSPIGKILLVCNGKRNKSAGYKWKFKEAT